MRQSLLPLPKAFAALTASLCLSGISSLAQPIDVSGDLSVGSPFATAGDGLNGEYWQRPVWSILTDGNTVRANGIDNQINGFGPATGTFQATLLNYTGNDLTTISTWLAGDAASLSPGTSGNLDDGAFRFTGFLNVSAAGVLNIGTTSDDGSRIKIGGIDIVNNDGGHGDATVDADVNFLSAGLYPIEVTYFNGDWTSDNAPDGTVNHSGNPDPGVHGGANFHLRVGGANVTSDDMFFTVPEPSTVAFGVLGALSSALLFFRRRQ
jgi:hypothetical protein